MYIEQMRIITKIKKGQIGTWISGKVNKARYILSSQDGMGVVEVILIIVVLIGLVIIFQTNIKSVVASIFSTIQKNAKSIK